MTTQAQTSSVRTAIVVDASIERAFTVFTEEIGSWWPEDHHTRQDERGRGPLHRRGTGSDERRARAPRARAPRRRLATDA